MNLLDLLVTCDICISNTVFTWISTSTLVETVFGYFLMKYHFSVCSFKGNIIIDLSTRSLRWLYYFIKRCLTITRLFFSIQQNLCILCEYKISVFDNFIPVNEVEKLIQQECRFTSIRQRSLSIWYLVILWL